MVEYRVGDKVRYTRGAQWTVLGRSGVVLRVYKAHGETMLEVDFGLVIYPCWVANVDPEEEEVMEVDFTEAEVETAPARGPRR
jgi:hypothetical protein